ncbi:hypothetical protein C900_05546 [Fulvivirga imtechensis AK7]|uniref:Uncharacterized protein n=1 Tax=Fulvivirga imtechensis AK7 TaxID=1237149 RepID=L8JL76_9BACT|nr:hypothetical protein C900_05546 [Fulvivirga imtechensis AK7]
MIPVKPTCSREKFRSIAQNEDYFGNSSFPKGARNLSLETGASPFTR